MLNAEAYVLFYRKSNDKIEPVRSEMHQLLEEAQTHPSLLQFYVSRQWINKLENVAEPGIVAVNIFALRWYSVSHRAGCVDRSTRPYKNIGL